MADPVSLVYLDVDDEITSAASRIRTAGGPTVALVLPAGSRLATSRINFRLLAREAESYGRDLLIVAPEGATRALAASAGLAVFATVRDLEARAGDEPAGGGGVTGPAGAPPPSGSGPSPRPAPDRIAKPRRRDPDGMAGQPSLWPAGEAAEGPAADGGRGERPGSARGAIAGRSAAADLPVHAGPHRGTSHGRAWLVGLVVVVLIAFVGGFIGMTYLPAATIVVTPKVETVGPLTFNVTADPAASAPDLAAAIVPASQPEIPLDATGDFPATTKKVSESKATGTVTFSSYDTGRANRIAAGSVVATQSDIQFVLMQTVILPPATLIGSRKNPTVVPSTGDSPVTAVKAGTAGNVAAGAIKIVPSDENPVVTTVTNQAAMAGGTHTETLVVGQKDIDKAVATLTAEIDANLDQVLAEPGQILPDLTVFPATKTRTDPVLTSDPASLLGEAVQSFTLGMTATGTVIAVDESAVTALATSRLRATITAGDDLVKDSLTVSVGDGRVVGSTIVFPVRASAQQVRRLVAADLRDAIRGKSLADARSILEAFGDTTISLWPGFLSTIPTQDSRIDLTVREAAQVEGSPAPSSSAGSTPRPSVSTSPRPSPRPSTTGSAKPSGAGSPGPSGSVAP